MDVRSAVRLSRVCGKYSTGLEKISWFIPLDGVIYVLNVYDTICCLGRLLTLLIANLGLMPKRLHYMQTTPSTSAPL